jgi:hypothetical protein
MTGLEDDINMFYRRWFDNIMFEYDAYGYALELLSIVAIFCLQ